MIRVSSAEFQRDAGRYEDLALTQPVAVTRDGHERTIMISAEEYERLKRRDRQVLTLDDFTEEDLAAIAAAEPSEDAKKYDFEVEGWLDKAS